MIEILWHFNDKFFRLELNRQIPILFYSTFPLNNVLKWHNKIYWQITSNNGIVTFKLRITWRILGVTGWRKIFFSITINFWDCLFLTVLWFVAISIKLFWTTHRIFTNFKVISDKANHSSVVICSRNTNCTGIKFLHQDKMFQGLCDCTLVSNL